jgi:hypothetical protein
LILAPLVFRRLKRRCEFLQIHWYVLTANGQEQPYSEVTDSSRSLAQSTRSRHTRRFETVISTNWHSRFLLRGLFGVRMEGGAPHRAR